MKMNVKNARTFAAAMALFAFMPLTAAVSVNEGLFFNLGYKGDVDEDGTLDKGEIGNLMTIGRASGWEGATKELTGAPGQDPIQIENVKVPVGYWLQSAVTNEKSVLCIPQATVYGTDGTYSNSQQTVHFADTRSDVNARSGLIRFRWDGYAFTNKIDMLMFSDCWLYTGDNTTARGLAFGISNDNKLNMWVGRICSTSDRVLTPGKWYDLAFSVGNYVEGGKEKAKIRFALASEGHVMGYNFVNGKEVYTNEKDGISEMFKEVPYDVPLNMDYTTVQAIKLGGQDDNSTQWREYIATNGTYRKAFKGAFANVKLWSRVLSDEELVALLADNNGMQWSIGAQNGSSEEFGGNPVPEFDPAANAWSQMKKTLDADSPTLTFKTKMRKGDEGLQKSLRVVSMLSEDATGGVSLSVNGVAVESASLENGKEHVFVIPAAKWTADSAGFVTVSISRTGDVAGTLEFDAISLSGAWQVGYVDKSVAEFVSNEKLAPSEFFIGDFDVTNHVRKALYSDLTTWSANRLRFHFWVDGRMAKKADAVFTSAIPNKSNPSEKPEEYTLFKVYLNEVCVHEVSAKKLDGIKVQIERGTMKEGLNVIDLRNCSERNDIWAQFDYFRMEFKREFAPFAITVR